MRTLSYDTRGNVARYGDMTFAYGLNDRMIRANSGVAGVPNSTYTYDGHGRRAKSVVGGETHYSVYLSDGELVHKREVDAAGNTVTESDLVRANGALVVEFVDGVPEYTHTDHLGTVSTRTDADGLLTQQEYYTPYGEPMGWQRPGEQELGFTGHLKDKTTGLTYMQARHYDPVSGRFLSTDPVGFASIGDPRYVNRYSYAGNDPVNNIDQDGRLIGKALKLARNVHKADGNMFVGGVETAVGIVEDVGTLIDGELNGDDLVAVVSLVTGFDKKDQAAAKSLARKVSGRCCFVAGTLVETERGLRPIEDIDIGDRVLSRNPETGETAYKDVTDLIRLNQRVIWEVSLSSEGNTSEFFETTDDHPWWIVEADGSGSWKTTELLSKGMLVTTADGRTMVIKEVSNTSQTNATYNLTVADFETYFVGENRVLVHNCKKNRSTRPDPLAEAEGRPHTIVERPGADGQYTTHNGDGTFKQYRGSGEGHNDIARPNVKENTLNESPSGESYPGKSEVRPARPDEVPSE